MSYQFLKPNPAGIPPELTAIPRWVTWKAIQKSPGLKPTKVPFRADAVNAPASSTDPDTWCSFEQAVTEAARLMNASAKMMQTYQQGLSTLQRIRTGGQQTIQVQHVHVSQGGQAVIGNVQSGAALPGKGEGK